MTSYPYGFMKLAYWQIEVKEGNLMYKSKSFDKDSQKLYAVKNFITILWENKDLEKLECHVGTYLS